MPYNPNDAAFLGLKSSFREDIWDYIPQGWTVTGELNSGRSLSADEGHNARNTGWPVSNDTGAQRNRSSSGSGKPTTGQSKGTVHDQL